MQLFDFKTQRLVAFSRCLELSKKLSRPNSPSGARMENVEGRENHFRSICLVSKTKIERNKRENRRKRTASDEAGRAPVLMDEFFAHEIVVTT